MCTLEVPSVVSPVILNIVKRPSMRQMIFLAILFSVSLLNSMGPEIGFGATYYVATSGGDINSGTEANPFKSIVNGVSQMSAGDTLIVKEGTYTEDIDNMIPGGTSWRNKTTIRANDGDTVILKPSSSTEAVLRFSLSSQKFIEIDGLILDAVNVQIYGVQIWGSAHHIRLRNMEIKNAPNQGVSILPDGGKWPNNNEIINVEIHGIGPGNSCLQFHGRHGFCHGMYIGSHSNVVENCHLYDNDGFGVQFYPQGDNNSIRGCRVHDNNGTGIGMYWGSGGEIVNNVIWNNNQQGIAVSTTDVLVYHNTVYNNNLDGIRVFETSGVHLVNNISFQNAESNILNQGVGTTLSNNITSNPNFNNPETADFSLNVNSPAIDAGVSVSPVASVDVNGVMRPVGSGFDVGAYEFGGTAPNDDPPDPPTNLQIIQN